MTGMQSNPSAQQKAGQTNPTTAIPNNTDVSLLEAIRSGEMKAQIQRYAFRFSQWSKRPDSLLGRYRHRLTNSWKQWLGIGAGITGLLMLASPQSFWQWQFPIIVLLLLIAPLFFDLSSGVKELFNTSPGQHFIGEVIILERPITKGMGSINLQKEEWKIAGPDCDAGTRVKIVGVDEKQLHVVLAD